MSSRRLATRWSGQVDSDHPLPEYPRPQLVRDEWESLNGCWDYAIRRRGEGRPSRWDGRIVVPFPVESSLSGVARRLGPDERLWYRRTFTTPRSWAGQRLLLHLAADWHTIVRCNGTRVGEHRGGFTPFTVELTEAKSDGDNELVIIVADPTNRGRQARGKQTLRPKLVFYTAVSGIWQTVWLEPVPATSIQAVHLAPDVERGALGLTVSVDGGASAGGDDIIGTIEIRSGDRPVAEVSGPVGQRLWADLPAPRPWTPTDPHLYDLRVRLNHVAVPDGAVEPIDTVRSHAALRSTAVGRDARGDLRLLLNGEPVFHHGPLDQGWWPDGLYTAPTDEALRHDIEITRELGFNATRKHIKVEPARWYDHCDRLGLLVWQDIPNPGIFPYRTAKWRRWFEEELDEIVDHLRDVPSVVVWVPFNEAWGQWDTARITDRIRRLDSSRPIDSASGWIDRGVGDIRSAHRYPGPARPKPDDQRAVACSEYGGIGLEVDGHTWATKRNWGYRKSRSERDLTRRYLELMEEVRARIPKGLAASIYTQLTDVEREVNGLLTYDRKIVKVDAQQVADRNRAVIAAGSG